MNYRRGRVKKEIIKIESIAFTQWCDSLAKKGFPRNKDNTWMNYSELYEYWLSSPDRNNFILHAKFSNVNITRNQITQFFKNISPVRLIG